MHIEFRFGSRQRFTRRYHDITVPGRVLAAGMPVRRAVWRLNEGALVPFYVEHVPDLWLRAGRQGGWLPTPIDWRIAYKDSSAALRLKELGDFNIEIPVDSPELRHGANRLELEIEDHGKVVDHAVMTFDWDPTPRSLPVDLADLDAVDAIQDVAQITDGHFSIDRERGAIVSVAPVAPDALCLLGWPARSQEATYRIVSDEPRKAKYVGLSDFFVGHEPDEVDIGIKPGYSTAGLATIRFDGEARSWLANADNGARRDRWLVCTEPPAEFLWRAGVPYRVRHQLLFEGIDLRTRFRIWPETEAEPANWLCEESTHGVDPVLPRFASATFGLFQHTGASTAWSDIRVVPLEDQP